MTLRRTATARLAAAVAVMILTLLTRSRPVRAQSPLPCDSCATCTTALAGSRARVELSTDIDAEAMTPCIVIRGDHALLDGHEHGIRGPGSATSTAVRIESADVVVRNVHVSRVGVGIEIASAARVTLYHDRVEASETGIRVVAADSPRIVRCDVRGGNVGVTFGDPSDDHCATNVALRTPGAVVHRTHVEGTRLGIAACDALPVLTENTIERNGVGLVLGSPSRGTQSGPAASAPFDPCVCAPDLDGVHRGTTLLFSSGCGGCMVHEGWLPSLRASGHEIRARETGPANAAASERFDAFAERCTPEITDALGIPGCVPNYACPASGATFKIRNGERALTFEAQLNGEADVGNFATACARAANQNYGPGRSCVRYQLRGNSVCGNRTVDIRAAAGSARFGGLDNHCGTADGWSDSMRPGCSAPCGTTANTATTGNTAANTATEELMSSSQPPRTAEPSAPVPPESVASSTPVALPVAVQGRVTQASPIATSDDAPGSSRWFGVASALIVGGVVLRQIRRRRLPKLNPAKEPQ